MSYLHTVAVETVLARDVLPESSTDLVTLKIYVNFAILPHCLD